MPANVIEVGSLVKVYRKAVAVDSLSFSVSSGAVTGFLGPNGAGKTTTLRCLLGLARPTAGTATIKGVPYSVLPTPARTVGAVLESAGFHPGRKGRDHLEVLARESRLAPGRVEEVLEAVHLSDAAGRRVKGYSLGMRQRLALAAALLGDPEILVLDEPGNGLDPEGIRWLRQLLRSLAAEGRTVLVSSHVLSEMAQLADEVVIIARGRLVKRSTVAELTASASKAVRVRSVDAAALTDALSGAGYVVVPGSSGELVVAESTTEEVGKVAAAAGVVISGLEAEPVNLEDVFLDLTRGKAL
ncbi:MAG: ABC transporter ATP-binding protein [Acidimicrobiales bacterium]